MKADSARKYFEEVSWDDYLANVRGVILIYRRSHSRIVTSPKAFQKTDVRPFLKIKIGGYRQRHPEIHALGAIVNHDLALIARVDNKLRPRINCN